MHEEQRAVPTPVLIATWTFCASFFFVEIARNSDPFVSLKFLPALEMAVMLGLFAVVVLARPEATTGARRKVTIALLAIWALLLIEALYSLAYRANPIIGPSSIYLERAARLGVYLVSILVYALFFFDRDLLLRVFWRIGLVVIAVCYLSFALYEAVGSRYLLNFRGGTVRVQAFFSEPSGLAPFVPAMLILALRQRRRFVALLTLGLVVLTKSPTVMLVTGLSLPAYWFLVRGNRVVKASAVALVAIFFAFSVNAVTLDPYALAQSDSSVRIAVARLIFGVNSIRSGGDEGYNARFDNTLEVWRALDAHGLVWTGYGLNSGSAYFLFRDGLPRENSLPLTVLFSYGVVGLTLFGLAALVATRRILRDDPAFAALFLPFLIASLVNSAGAFVTYKFVLLGICCYFFKWPTPHRQWVHAPLLADRPAGLGRGRGRRARPDHGPVGVGVPNRGAGHPGGL